MQTGKRPAHAGKMLAPVGIVQARNQYLAGPAAGGVHEAVAVDEQADMRKRAAGVKKHQIARAQVIRRGQGAGHFPRRARQQDALALIDVPHEAAAIEALLPRCRAVAVRRADQAQRIMGDRRQVGSHGLRWHGRHFRRARTAGQEGDGRRQRQP